MLQAELSPNSAATSAPKGTVARPYKLPRSLKDPRIAAAFSSFTPRTFVDSNQALRRRENKLKRIADKAEQARKAAAIVNPTPLQIATATIPAAPRAGYMGVEISVDAEGLPLPKRTKPDVAPPTPPTTPPAETPKKPTFTIPFLSFAAPRHTAAPVVHPPVTPPPSPPLASLEETEPQRRARVEAYLVRNHPKLAGFTFAHRSGNPGQPTTFVDASRRAFATRIERPKGLAGVSEELEREIRGTTTRPMKSDGLRGAHEIRQIGVHRETGAIEPIYSGAFTRAPLKWLHLMRGKAFGRIRGHVSRW